MSVTTEVTETIVEVEVADDYTVTLVAHDIAKRVTARVPLTWEQAAQVAAELLGRAQGAHDMVRADTAGTASHGFDRDLPATGLCQDCAAGKHRACIGSAYVESVDGMDVDEVACACAAVNHGEQAS